MNKTKLKKIGKGTLIASGGAGLTFLLGELSNIDFGAYTGLVYIAASTLINAALKYLETQKT